MSDEISDIDEEFNEEQFEIPDVLPLLPIRDVVIFPYMIVPLFVGRERSINAVDAALTKDRLVFLSTQRDVSKEDPDPEDLNTFGTVGMIMRMLKLPDGRVKILVQGLSRSKIKTFLQTQPFYTIDTLAVEEPPVVKAPLEIEALMRNVREVLERLASLGKVIFPEVMMVLENVQEPGRLADLVAANLGLKTDDAQKVLEILDPIKRLQTVSDLLVKEFQVAQMQSKIQSQAKEEMDKSQREYYLREQLKAIKTELGDIEEASEEINDFKDKIRDAKMPPDIEKEAIKQADRLDMMHPDAAEATLTRTYLEWLIDLPWSKQTKDILDIKKAKEILDADHYDLEKVKERILEYLAVRKLKNDTKGPILCFVGPPGVGKTSLGKSIARSIGRKFVRLSLGGVRDEAEIRGHRRTYVGALPGRIIQGMKQAGTNNPVFMMDEIDKIGADFRGDPSSALLEVLDPEQNNSFSDHYLNLPFDLTNVMFITTANQMDPIPGPLKDRMEIIYIPGYTSEEKLVIAKRYLVPRQVKENGLTDKLIKFSDESITKIITEYTREAGLRNLEREIAGVCRKIAKNVAAGDKKLTKITPARVHEYLGIPKHMAEEEREKDEVGVATGLAWTPVGGEVLYIETTIMKGRGQLTLTGHLGDVMKESAQAAYSYARARAKELGIPPDFYKDKDIHVHVPAGAIPKDGPSAGITMATSIVSALTQTPIDKDLAMTGEITLRGRILPIGGLKEKCLAALRAGIKTVLCPDRNKKDLEEIPDNIKNQLNIVLVGHMDEVLSKVLKIKIKKKTSTKKPSSKKALTKKAAPKKKVPIKKKATAKKATPKKKTVAKKAVVKKTVPKKKAAPKKTVPKKKTAVKKTAPGKKAAAKKPVKKKAGPAKAASAKAASAKAAPKKKASANKKKGRK
ncbi:ATP-dependent protease La Type I [hydrothermal vent metagenome]|uniref:ATP-dependent protease La Type I n=1 Tax=hydrothermal vent metagenome TaxID=652676 RepID=A0A3B0V6G3_9ZZZZ